jgi:hypothetical protein
MVQETQITRYNAADKQNEGENAEKVYEKLHIPS